MFSLTGLFCTGFSCTGTSDSAVGSGFDISVVHCQKHTAIQDINVILLPTEETLINFLILFSACVI